MTFLKIDTVSKTYPGAERSCLENLNLELKEGEIVVILGHSGCGKTTLLKMIAGLEGCDSGEIRLNDETINDIPPHKRPISMVFQKPLLFKNLTVEDNINFSPRIKGGMDKDEMHEEVLRLLKLVELEGYENRKANQLSGGQEQRVSLARALMTKPKLLLLDEPFSALDAELRVTLRQKLRTICKEIGQTVIFVTHDQQEAVAVADRIALMQNGRIIQDDVPSAFYHRPSCKESAQFFGWSNAIPAVKEGDVIRCRLGDFTYPESALNDGDVTLMVHPQAASYAENGRYGGTVIGATYMGILSNYEVDCDGLTMRIQIKSRTIFTTGETVRFDLDENMVWPVSSEPLTDDRTVCPKKKGLLQTLQSLDLFKKKETNTDDRKEGEP